MANKKKGTNEPQRLVIGFVNVIGNDTIELTEDMNLESLGDCDNTCDCYVCDTCY